jgi:apolipoprotein N-acyltransferase
VRYALFVVVTVALVGFYCWVLWRVLPPLRTEPAALLLLPMTWIATIVSIALYPVIRRNRRRSRQAIALYVGFVVSAILYGCYLWIVIPHGTAGMIPLALMAAHLYGLPLYFAVFVAQRLMGGRLFTRSNEGRAVR